MPEFFDIDRYAGLKSPIHDWDPRTKLVSILLLIFSIVLTKDLMTAFIGLFFAVLLLTISRIPISFVLGYLRWVALFLSFLFIVLLLTVPGKEIMGFYLLSVSKEGLYMASLISLRAFSAVLLIFPMMGTTRFDHTLKALEKLRVPNKFIQVMIFTYRYIFLLVYEFQRISRSLEARGFRKRTDVYTMKTIGKAIGILLVKSYERAENVYHAMSSRGYNGTFRVLVEFKMCNRDWLKAFMVGGMAVSLHGIGFV